MNVNRRRAGWIALAVLLGAAALLWGAWAQIAAAYQHIGTRRALLVLAVFVAFGVIGSLLLAVKVLCLPALERVENALYRARAVFWLAAAALGVGLAYFIGFTGWGDFLAGSGARLWLFWGAVTLLAALTPRSAGEGFGWARLAGGVLLLGSITAAAASLQMVVSYPFSIGWSEGNRIWDYSMMFGRARYQLVPDRPVQVFIEPGRQGLWGLPFLIPGVSIQGLRLWNELLFSLPYIFFGWLVFRPRRGEPAGWLFMGLWTYLFFAQAPVYTGLVLCAILVALARRLPLIPALLLVGCAGYYAGLSRSTWVFAPALWAGVLALASQANLSTARRWLQAVGLGATGLLAGYVLPKLLRAQGASGGGTGGASLDLSLQGIQQRLGQQALLWERLFPNTTYAPGILLGILMAAGPLLAVLIWLLAARRWKLNRWAGLALGGMLLGFLAAGLVISVKIGGGSNLHNLDMFLVSLVFAAGLAWEAALAEWPVRPQHWPGWVNVLLLAAVLHPAAQPFLTLQPMHLPAQALVETALERVRLEVRDAAKDGTVLFMDQRQLLTFGEVPPVALVTQYEKKYLMEQALRDNETYFQTFYAELAAHHFSLIVSEPLRNAKEQADRRLFGYENDAWVKWVSGPVLCYYSPVVTYAELDVQLLVPRTGPPPESLGCPAQ